MSDTAETAAPGRQTKRGAAVDLKAMDVGQLRQLIADAENELAEKQDAARSELRAKWQAEAAEAGLSFDAVTAGPASEKGRKSRKDGGAKRAVKFRNLETGETWSGVGREPSWIKGKDREGFKIT